MIIDVDPASPVPAFEQVRAQLAQMIASGVLPEGHRLPPIRQLAADLALAPGTVARVYRELEHDGLIKSRVRHGTVVTARNPNPVPRPRPPSRTMHGPTQPLRPASAPPSTMPSLRSGRPGPTLDPERPSTAQDTRQGPPDSSRAALIVVSQNSISA